MGPASHVAPGCRRYLLGRNPAPCIHYHVVPSHNCVPQNTAYQALGTPAAVARLHIHAMSRSWPGSRSSPRRSGSILRNRLFRGVNTAAVPVTINNYVSNTPYHP